MMRQYSLADGLARLEAISADFDYDKIRQYVMLAKEYLREVRSIALSSPISDVSSEFGIDLPEGAKERLATFLVSKPCYAPTAQKVCRWYLLDLHAMDLNLKPAAPSVYEPLLRMLELGGDFYEHHGALCIRDAAALPFTDRMAQ